MAPEFISLEDFLTLADPLDTRWFRSVWRICPRAEYWPKYYALAKTSFERYGEAGPPIGSMVITLQPGHGGGAGCVRTFDGVYPEDEYCFRLYYTDKSYRKGEKQYSLVTRAHWWTDIYVIEDEKAFHKDWRAWDWLSR